MLEVLRFLVFDWLGAEALTARGRFSDHSRDTFDSILEVCDRLAREKFAPYARQVDVEEPRLEGEVVVQPPGAHISARAYVESGMLAASQDYEDGGLQLPCVVEMAANAFFYKAGAGLGGGGLLTTANASLIKAHGTATQHRIFAKTEFQGRWFGTMCLSETQAGSSLSDIATRAVPDGGDGDVDPLGPRYRLHGSKMWISNGDHELAENIVHLVLARKVGPSGEVPVGAKGLSLFIVPKKLVGSDGNLTGERNDVAVAGLNHKLGYRGIPNTLLNFGEGRFPVRGREGAIGYLVGRPGDGLRYMFHMMNEARIAVGLGAAAFGYAGYEASLNYARERRQGRPVGSAGKDPTQPQVPIIEHADVKRMLIAQKAYAEGGLALSLYCARLVDDQHTAAEEVRMEASQLLDLLTPVVKSWPSRWCQEATSLAIQVHGGYGYTRDFPVEKIWRDNRINMIHEGTHGIQALDLLGRKVLTDNGVAFQILMRKIEATAARASMTDDIAKHAFALRGAAKNLEEATIEAWRTGVPSEALANATQYLEAFGHTVMAWIWLDLACTAVDKLKKGDTGCTVSRMRGVLQTSRYFFEYELPQTSAWLEPVRMRSATCGSMQDAWF
jgi:butyryl-CoA dehydrogenase